MTVSHKMTLVIILISICNYSDLLCWGFGFSRNDIQFQSKKAEFIKGVKSVANKEYNELHVQGPFHFENIVIKNRFFGQGKVTGKGLICNKLEGQGSFKVENVQAETINRMGLFSVQKLTVSSDATFQGKVTIVDGTLKNVFILASRSIFKSSYIDGNISIKKSNDKHGRIQTLELKDGTVVSGDVIFEQAGDVYLYNGSEIKGKVVNGTIIKKQ
ncbi:hypothetical protein IPH25_02005 [bacterium]|nr:MAG: hypothetical protein IPG37_04135 [bacterium]QQR62198.1 MAG: hypothetical protein IPH25_02005 [bacterium]QQR63244.1 MAG: hypothetical protein IPH67_02095 [bacterium]